MPFNTNNPIPSGDLRDLDDNARNIDTWANDKTKLSHPDRFGVERYTWHGIEQKAQLDLADAVADATADAEQARDQAIAAKLAAMNAAASSGVTKYADTKAILTAGVGTAYINGDVVLVFADESQSGASAIYKIEANTAVFKTLFDQTRADLLSFTGTISADAEWSDVPAHSDPAFDVQAQALANRTELLKENGGSFDATKNYVSTTLNGAFVNRAVSPTDFPWLAKFDGITDDGASIQACMNWAASAFGVKVVLPAGTALSSISLIQPDFLTVEGMGRGDEEYFDSAPTKIIFIGTGAKTYSAPGLTARTVANPDAGAAYLSDSGTRGNTYSLVDFSTPFSAAWVIGKGGTTKGFAIFPNHNGVQGYISDSSGALSDEWDVGFYLRNAGAANVSQVTAAGHWRKAACLDATHAVAGDSRTVASERKVVFDCYFSGFRGLAIRGENPIINTSYGYGGTRYIKCFLRDLNHKSGRLATSSFLSNPFPSPSGALEIDGAVMRGISFDICTLMGRDDQLITFGDCQEIIFTGSYWEAKNAIVSGSWLTSLGVRAVRISGSATTSVYCYAHTKYGVDTSPFFTRGGEVTKYTAAGVFDPSRCNDDDYESPKYATSQGFRLRNSSDRFRVYGGEGLPTLLELDSSGALTIASRDFATQSDQMRLRVTRSGALTAWLYTLASGNIFAVGRFSPGDDNAHALGWSSNRWTQVYAANGTINTSDEREKTSWRDQSEAEKAAALEIKKSIKAFKFSDAVNSKGESARVHFGVGAQTVGDILRNHGLDPEAYAFWCYDEWDEQQEIKDEEGNILQEYRAAGSRYGIRYDELCMFILAAI